MQTHGVEQNAQLSAFVNGVALRSWRDAQFASEIERNRDKALRKAAKEQGITLSRADLASLAIPASPVGPILANNDVTETEGSWWTSGNGRCGRYFTATTECGCGYTDTGGCPCGTDFNLCGGPTY